MVELSGGERGVQRKWEKLPVDIGRVSGKIFVDQDGGDRKRTEAGCGLSAAASRGGECRAGSFSIGKSLGAQCIGAAFDDGSVKETLRGRRDELREDAEAPRRFAEDGHVQRIASEKPDVIANPAESELLIHEAIITSGIGIAVAVSIRIRLFPGKSGMSEKAESAETVINGHDDDPVLDKRGGIVVVAFTSDEGAAMDPNHHRARVEELVGVGSENIEKETILSDGRDAERRGWLRAVVGKLRSLQRREPRSMRNRRTPAQIAHRRRGIRNAQEFADASGSDRAADVTAEGEDQWFLFLRMNDKRHREKSDGGEENYWKQGKLLRMTTLHCFLSDRGTIASGVREEFPQLPTFGRRDGIVSVYIIILLLSIKRFHAAILRKPPLWRASSPGIYSPVSLGIINTKSCAASKRPDCSAIRPILKLANRFFD
jgi:hypothetical protein